jgi:D-alanyl-D-alanine carboxypeptidase (penicillin-binding protein 5/6)
MPIRIRSLSFTVVLLLTFAVADAANNMPIPAPPIIGAKSFLLLDGTTGTELASLEADKRLAPASLTKLMTAYVIFRALAADQITLERPGEPRVRGCLSKSVPGCRCRTCCSA